MALALSSGGAARADTYWECVTFARMFSGIQLFGNAWTWWNKAAGAYDRGSTPQAGSVLVFKPSGSMRDGHVAVVSQVLTDRIIQVTHANWSVIAGNRGKVEKDVTVVDVSPKGDWSQVKVWYDPVRDLGTSVYPTYGFIYQKASGAARSAGQQVAAVAAQAAASASQAPSSASAQVMAAAAQSTDRIAALIQSFTDH
ncbi:MAG TPA: CHAP domain-containing protein [Caulobacteraceae bacterium]|nr:CHAP domain-containing protein [Caulobacteraceae bacterium]